MLKFGNGDDFDRKVDLFLFATVSISIDVLIITNNSSYGSVEHEGYILKQRKNKWAIYYKEYDDIQFQALFANYDLALIYLCDKIVNFDKAPAIFQEKPEWEKHEKIKLDWSPP